MAQVNFTSIAHGHIRSNRVMRWKIKRAVINVAL